MRSTEHDTTGASDNEYAEYDKTKPVDNHSGEFPVVFGVGILVLFFHAFGDKLQFGMDSLHHENQGVDPRIHRSRIVDHRLNALIYPRLEIDRFSAKVCQIGSEFV